MQVLRLVLCLVPPLLCVSSPPPSLAQAGPQLPCSVTSTPSDTNIAKRFWGCRSAATMMGTLCGSGSSTSGATSTTRSMARWMTPPCTSLMAPLPTGEGLDERRTVLYNCISSSQNVFSTPGREQGQLVGFLRTTTTGYSGATGATGHPHQHAVQRTA